MRFAAFFVVLLGLAGAAAYATLNSFNYFDDVERSFAGKCTPVTGIAGPEDIQIDPARGSVFISSLDRRTKDSRGGVHVFDISNPLGAKGWRDMTMGAPADFKPLGLDYYEDGDVRRLFVVNEANNGVEMFDIGDDGALVHIETFTERRLTSPNNVVAVGRRSFYVTNDVRAGRNAPVADLYFLTRQASGQVFYSDGTVWRVAAEGLRFANGIEASADGAHIYVAETAAGTVRTYDRDARTGKLSLAKITQLSAAPDNITIDDAGALWVAALPKPLAVSGHGDNPDRYAPSEVIRIGADGAAQTIYRDDGGELSAATAAARLGETLIIGALYEKKFLICDLPAGEI